MNVTLNSFLSGILNKLYLIYSKTKINQPTNYFKSNKGMPIKYKKIKLNLTGNLLISKRNNLS